MQYAIMVAISMPIWFAACLSLLIGIVGSLSPTVKGDAAFRALALLPISSALFYIAAVMCGLITQ